jgi:hypothetical protein
LTVPEEHDVVVKCSNRRAIGWHAVVGEIPGDDLRKPFPGFRDWPVPSLSQRFLDLPEPTAYDQSGSTGLAKREGAVGSIADQAAGYGEFAPLIDRRNRIACCQRHELVELAAEERVGADDERAGALLDEGGESSVDLVFAAGL